MSLPLPTRAELDRLPRKLLNRGGSRNPDVYCIEISGTQLVVKDFAPRGALVRRTIGRWVTAREARAWQLLDGQPSVPAFRGRIDALAFAVEYRPGRRMGRKLRGEVPPDFSDRLDRALSAMHARGVVHLDLRHRSNVLLGEGGDPILIDFGSALWLRPGSLMARLFLPLFASFDLRAARKWRRKLAPPDQDEGSSGSGRGASRPT
ncbi:MAG: hypothetical protein GY723_15635 [bacterium]|nr:hypothetical protein [bacterium]MCP5065171.1 hypothetical protein [bacterium]